jgi:predicted naringenin-chalcone synthase
MAVVISKGPEPFRTNFASGAYERARLISAALYAVAVAALVLAGVTVWWAADDRRAAAAMQGNVDRVRQQSARLRDELQRLGFSPDAPGAVADLAKRVAGVNQILEQKAFSWTTLLNDLRRSAEHLDRVFARNGSGASFPDGTALTLQDLAKLMIALEQSGRFTDVFLQRQKTTERERVEFSIQCSYRRAG